MSRDVIRQNYLLCAQLRGAKVPPCECVSELRARGLDRERRTREGTVFEEGPFLTLDGKLPYFT